MFLFCPKQTLAVQASGILMQHSNAVIVINSYLSREIEITFFVECNTVC